MSYLSDGGAGERLLADAAKELSHGAAQLRLNGQPHLRPRRRRHAVLQLAELSATAMVGARDQTE
jgi:hypothetical protein